MYILQVEMRRTQIYITEEMWVSLRAIAGRLGETQSEVIRRAVDRYIVRYQAGNRLELLKQAKGMWRQRSDLADFEQIRSELDRVITAKER